MKTQRPITVVAAAAAAAISIAAARVTKFEDDDDVKALKVIVCSQQIPIQLQILLLF